MSESGLSVVNCEKEVARIGIENKFALFYEPCVLDDFFLEGRSLRNFADKPQGARLPPQRRSNVLQHIGKDFAAERIKKINRGYFIRDCKLPRVRCNKLDIAA